MNKVEPNETHVAVMVKDNRISLITLDINPAGTLLMCNAEGDIRSMPHQKPAIGREKFRESVALSVDVGWTVGHIARARNQG